VIIRSIRLQHFGIFHGDQELELGPGLSVIHGENGRGKTTLLNAVKWALFGTYEDRQGREVPTDVMLNREARRQGDRRFGVDLELDNGRSSVLVRRAAVVRQSRSTSSQANDLRVTTEGRDLGKGDAQRELTRILDRRLARFALFDGEQLQDYESLLLDDRTDTRLIRESIEQILGVRSLERTRDSLGAVTTHFQQEMARVARRERKADRLSEQASNTEQEVERLETEIAEVRRREVGLREAIVEQDALLQRYEQSMADLKTVEAKESEIDQLRRREDDLRITAADHMKWVPYDLLARVLQKVSRRSGSPMDRVRTTVLAAAADESLERMTCTLCGRPFSSGDLEEFRQLARDLLSNGHEEIGSDALLSALRLTAVRDSGRLDSFINLQPSIESVSNERVEQERELRALRGAVDSLPKGETRDGLRRRDALQQELGAVSDRARAMSTDLEAARAQLRRLFEQIAANVDPEASKAIRTKLEATTALKGLYESVMERYRLQLRDRVQHDATLAFRRLTHDPDLSHLRINDNYGLEIVGEGGEPMHQRSAGQEQLVALSLIAALHKNAFRPIPLMMDTPFGRLDPRHRQNVMSFFARQAAQVVLLVHGGEISTSDVDLVRERLTNEYELERVEPDITRIRAKSVD
jgi:DNA sulfur modification protein DndD